MQRIKDEFDRTYWLDAADLRRQRLADAVRFTPRRRKRRYSGKPRRARKAVRP